jgi:hypothetical protein
MNHRKKIGKESHKNNWYTHMNECNFYKYGSNSFFFFWQNGSNSFAPSKSHNSSAS